MVEAPVFLIKIYLLCLVPKRRHRASTPSGVFLVRLHAENTQILSDRETPSCVCCVAELKLKYALLSNEVLLISNKPGEKLRYD